MTIKKMAAAATGAGEAASSAFAAFAFAAFAFTGLCIHILHDGKFTILAKETASRLAPPTSTPSISAAPSGSYIVGL